MSLLIGLGHKSKHGKDTVAAEIIKQRSSLIDVRRYAFGDELKLEAYHALLNPRHPYWAAMAKVSVELFYHNFALPKPQSFYEVTDEDKLKWIAEHKEPLRHMLQTYGTEFRRNVDPFYWVRKLGEKINRENPQIALITDMRFLNETFFVKANDGITIKVERTGYDNGCSGHISEQQLEGYKFDYEIIVPDGNLDELLADAVGVFDNILEDLTHKDMPTSEFTEEGFAKAA